MNPLRHMVSVGHNVRVFIWNWRPTQREEMVKLWLEGNMRRDTWSWRRALRIPPPGCLWHLGPSASTLTQPFRLDGNIFCCCRMHDSGMQLWDSLSNCTIWYRHYILSLPESQAPGAPEWSWRGVLYSQHLRNFTDFKAWFYSILKMTSYSVEYSCILFRNFSTIEEHLSVRLRAPEKHIILHSACSVASGIFWKNRCGCSE